MGSGVPGGDKLRYDPAFILRMNGKDLGSFKNIRIVGKVEKNKEPPVVVDYVDNAGPVLRRKFGPTEGAMIRIKRSYWEGYQKRMSPEGRWTKVRTETGRIEKNVEKNSLEGMTDWERRITLIIASHEK